MGPQRTAEMLAERLCGIAGLFAKYRDTGGYVSPEEVRLLVDQLDRGAAEAERLAGEIGDLTTMILDMGEDAQRAEQGAAEAPMAPWVRATPSGLRATIPARERLARLKPWMTIIEGGKP
jgi:hypothetical protein